MLCKILCSTVFVYKKPGLIRLSWTKKLSITHYTIFSDVTDTIASTISKTEVESQLLSTKYTNQLGSIYYKDFILNI